MTLNDFNNLIQKIEPDSEEICKRWDIRIGTLAGYEKERGNSIKTADWFRDVLAGHIVQTQAKYGDAVAKQLISLAVYSACSFPWEVLRAAEHLAKGGTIEEIQQMMEEDGLLDEVDSDAPTEQIPPA